MRCSFVSPINEGQWRCGIMHGERILVLSSALDTQRCCSGRMAMIPAEYDITGKVVFITGAYLASAASDYMTGPTIFLDGSMSL